MVMPKTPPMMITRSSRPLHCSVAGTECAMSPWSTALPTIHGPIVSGSCQSTPTSAAVATTPCWLRITDQRNRPGERRSGPASGVSPGSV